MTLTRKDFCQALAAGTALLGLPGCGGGGDSAPAPAPPPAAGSCGSSGAEISGNHGHVLTLARADLDSASALTYGIEGSALHNHNVTLTPAQLQALKAGGNVSVVSTTTDAHNHSVLVTCT